VRWNCHHIFTNWWLKENNLETVKKVMESLGVRPKLRLGRRKDKDTEGKGGVESYGPKHIKALAEPEGITANNFEGKPTKFLRFLVEHNGQEFFWFVPVLNKEGQPNYLLERVAAMEVGKEYILEMKRQKGRNHIEVTNADGTPLIAQGMGEPAEGEDDEQEDIEA
jgi:hypothetical protein